MAKYTCRQNNILQPIKGGGMHLGGPGFFFPFWGRVGDVGFLLFSLCSHQVPKFS